MALSSEFIRFKEEVERELFRVWTPHKGQIPIIEALLTFWCTGVFVRCGRKFGKTDVAIALMYIFGELFDNAEIYYVADEKEHATDILWDNGRLPYFFTTQHQDFLNNETDLDFAVRKKAGFALQKKWVVGINNSEHIVRLQNGSFIKVEGAKNFTIADGLSPVLVVYDEFKDHDKRFDIRMRPNLYALRGRILIIGTPPDSEDTYYCEVETEFKNRKGHKTFKMPSYMNEHVYPGGINSPELKEEEKAYRARGEYHVFAREFLAEIYPDTQRAIFPMFSKSQHVKPYYELKRTIQQNFKKWDFYASYDPASTSTFAVLLVAINRLTKTVLLMDEIYEQEQMNTQSKLIYKRAETLRMEIQPDLDDWTQVYDHAEAWFQTEIALEFGIGISPCQKDMNNKEAKLSVIKDCMLYGRFYISDRCVHTIKEYSNYAKDEKGRIPKENDHNIDNTRYIINAAAYASPPRVELNYDDISGRRFFTPDYDRRHDDINDMERFLGGNDDDTNY